MDIRAGMGLGGLLRVAVLLAAGVSLLGCAIIWLHSPQKAALSYLAAYIFFLGPAVGSVGLLMVHALTGGRWGVDLRPALLAATRVLPVLALLLIPLLASVPWLYPWAQGALVSPSPWNGGAVNLVAMQHLSAQVWYLNRPFFLARAIVCFALWLFLSRSLANRLLDPRRALVLPRFAAAGLIVYLVTVTIAAVDWIMSLVPAWHSATFGLLVGTGQIVSAAALAVVVATGGAGVVGGQGAWGGPRTSRGPEAAGGKDTATPASLASRTSADRIGGAPPSVGQFQSADGAGGRAARVGDLGSLLLMLVLGWAYLAFMDYLTTWTGDLPSDTVWYLPRLKTSWHWLAVWLVMTHLVLPFVVLLARRAKRDWLWLRGTALLLLIAQATYALWLVVPSFRPAGFSLEWSDALAWIGIGGVCWVVFDFALVRARIDAQARAPIEAQEETENGKHTRAEGAL